MANIQTGDRAANPRNANAIGNVESKLYKYILKRCNTQYNVYMALLINLCDNVHIFTGDSPALNDQTTTIFG